MMRTLSMYFKSTTRATMLKAIPHRMKAQNLLSRVEKLSLLNFQCEILVLSTPDARAHRKLHFCWFISNEKFLFSCFLWTRFLLAPSLHISCPIHILQESLIYLFTSSPWRWGNVFVLFRLFAVRKAMQRLMSAVRCIELEIASRCNWGRHNLRLSISETNLREIVAFPPQRPWFEISSHCKWFHRYGEHTKKAKPFIFDHLLRRFSSVHNRLYC